MDATLPPRLKTLVRIARAAEIVVMRHYEGFTSRSGRIKGRGKLW